MNFLQSLWSRLTGSRRREDDDDRSMVGLQSPAPYSLPRQAPSSSSPAQRFVQQPLQAPLPADIPQPPKQLRKLDTPSINRTAIADQIERQAQADSIRSWVTNPIGNLLTKNTGIRDVAAPAVAGAARASGGAAQGLSWLARHSPGGTIINGLSRLMGRPSISDATDDLANRYSRAIDERASAVEASSPVKVPSWVPAFGGKQPVSEVSRQLANPLNAIPLTRPAGLGLRALSGAVTGGAAASFDPAQTDQERVRNVAGGAAIGAILSSLLGPRLVTAAPTSNSVPNSLANQLDDSLRQAANPVGRPLNQRILENMSNQGASADQMRAYIATLPANEQEAANASMKSVFEVLDKFGGGTPNASFVNNMPTDPTSIQFIMQDMINKGASPDAIRAYIATLPAAQQAAAQQSVESVLSLIAPSPPTAATPEIPAGVGNEARRLFGGAIESGESLLRRLNQQVEEQLLRRDLGDTSSIVFDPRIDTPAFQRIGRNLATEADDIPSVRPAVIDTPSIVNEAVPAARNAEQELLQSLSRTAREQLSGATDTDLDIPTFIREAGNPDRQLLTILRQIERSPNTPESVLEVLRNRRSPAVSPEEIVPTSVSPTQQAIDVPNVPKDAAITNPVAENVNPLPVLGLSNAPSTVPSDATGSANQLALNNPSDTIPTNLSQIVTDSNGLPVPVDALLGSMRQAEQAQANLAPIRATERGSRAAQGMLAFDEAGGGEEGFRAAMRELSGKYSTASFNPLSIDPTNQNDFINLVQVDGQLMNFEKINTIDAFRKLWGSNPEPPTPSDIRYMRSFLDRYIDTTASTPTVTADAKALMNATLDGVEKAVQQAGTGWRDVLGQVIALPRTATTTLDFSMGLRQGAPVATRYFPQWLDANTSSAAYAFSPETMAEDMGKITQDADFTFVNDVMKMRMPAVDGLNDEAMQAARLLGKIPLYGRLTDASARAYDGGLTKLRWNIAKSFVDNLGGRDAMLSQYTEADIRKMGSALNTLTGYGDFGDNFLLDKVLDASSIALFAPRLWASRLQMLNPAFYATLPAPARNAAITSMGSFLGTAALVLSGAVAAAQAAGHDDISVSVDPLNADFLKLKVGNTRYDILAGLQQNIVLLMRQALGAKVSSTTGIRTELGGGYGDPNRFDLLIDTFANKLNPLFAFGVNYLRTGKEEGQGNPFIRRDRFGGEYNMGTEALKLGVPLSVSGLAELYNDTGSAFKSLLMNAPALVGVGQQTYGTTRTQDKQNGGSLDTETISRSLDDQGIPNPYNYQGENSFSDEVQRYRESDNFTIVAQALEAQYQKMEAEGATQKKLGDLQRDIDIARVAEQNAIPYNDLSMYYGAISGIDSAQSVSNAEFKRLIDPDDENYNPDLAQRLYQVDSLMAQAGVSSNTTDRSRNYYTLPKTSSVRSSGSSTGGTVSAPPSLRSLSLSSFSPRSLRSLSIPNIRRTLARETVRPRRITVS